MEDLNYRTMEKVDYEKLKDKFCEKQRKIDNLINEKLKRTQVTKKQLEVEGWKVRDTVLLKYLYGGMINWRSNPTNILSDYSVDMNIGCDDSSSGSDDDTIINLL